MRLVKMLGLAAIAAVVAMAFVGATSASATNLCNSHSAVTCEEGQEASSVSMVNEGVGTLLTDLVNVLCLTISASGTPLADSQTIHISSLSFTNCGTKATHENCKVSVLGDLPLVNLFNTGLDAGTIVGTDGEILVNCDNIDIFGIDIHCVYDGTGLEFPVGNQHLTADNTQVDKISGSLCSEESYLDGLLETTANRYVLWAPFLDTALCKEHKGKVCEDDKLVTAVHFVAKNQGVEFEKGKYKVQCKESLLKGSVGKLGLPQTITVEEVTWDTCENGAEVCIISTKDPGEWDVLLTDLNNAIVSLTLSVEIVCGDGDKIQCTVTPLLWDFNGSTGGHKGKIVGKDGVFEKSGKCPEPITWTLKYESLDYIYVLE